MAAMLKRVREALRRALEPGILNRRQGISLWAGIGVFLLMGLFPPWYQEVSNRHRLAYGFLLWPPGTQISNAGDMFTTFRIDKDRLYVQWAMVAVVTGGLMLTFHGRKPKPLALDAESSDETPASAGASE